MDVIRYFKKEKGERRKVKSNFYLKSLLINFWILGLVTIVKGQSNSISIKRNERDSVIMKKYQRDSVIMKNNIYLILNARTSSFKVYQDNKYVNRQYLEYLKKRLITSCFANPGEVFNETDLIDLRLCNYRLVLIGENLNFKNQWCIIYESGSMNGVYRNCDFFEVNDSSLVAISVIGVSPDINNIRKLKRSLKNEDYSLMLYPVYEAPPELLQKSDSITNQRLEHKEK